MKRYSLFRICILSAVTVLMAFQSCTKSEDGTETSSPQITLQAVHATSGSISFTLTASHCDRAAYLVLESANGVELTAQDIIMSGTNIDITAPFTAAVNNLLSETEYTVYAVAARDEEYSDIATLSMSTTEEEPVIPDVTDEIAGAYVRYYGEQDTQISGVSEYVLNLSTREYNEDGSSKPSSYMYRLTLVAPTSADGEHPELPEGTYVYEDLSDGGTPAIWTITAGTCGEIGPDGDGINETACYPRTGTYLTVTKKGSDYVISGLIHTEIMFAAGSAGTVIRQVDYSGPMSYRFPEGTDDPGQVTVGELKEDILDISLTTASGVNYGRVAGYPAQDNIYLEFANMSVNDITGGYRGPGEALYLDMETIVLEEIEENGSHTLRVGDASKDEGRLRPGSWPEQTSLPEGTYLAHIDESGNFHIGVVVSGTAEITRTGSEYTVTFDFTTSNGSKLSGTFNGQIPVRDMGMENIYTSLTEDYVIPSVGGSTASARYYGDRNWGITITWPVSADVVENFYIDLTGDSDDPSEGIPAGTYNVGNYYDRTDFTFMPAYDINDIYAVFNREYTYWLRTSAGEVTGQAPVIGGSIEVSRSGDDYTFTFNVTDDDRNAITGSWTGQVTIENAN